MFDTAVLRSGFTIQDSVTFSKRILDLLYVSLDIDPDTPVRKSREDQSSHLKIRLNLKYFALVEKL